MSPSDQINFSDVTLDLKHYELKRSGEVVKVQPRIFDLLLHFCQNPNKVFSRDELIEAVWVGRLVSDSTVSSAIKNARKAIGDDGNTQTYIKTLHGRGFSFVGRVEPPTGKKYNQVPAIESTDRGVFANKLSLLVLPGHHVGDTKQNSTFADNLAADLEVVLSRIPLLEISDQAQRFAQLDTRLTARQIHEEVGVDYVLQCNVQLHANQYKLTIQLSDAKAGFRIWTEQFTQNIEMNIEDASSAIMQIVARLEPQLNRAIYNTVRSKDGEPNAKELFLQASGLLALKGWHSDTFMEAAELLRSSAKLDPELAYAPAYLSLILAFGHRVGLTAQNTSVREKVIDAAEHALKLDDMDSTVLGYVGCALSDIGMFARSKPLLRKALQANQANGQAWTALGAIHLSEKNYDKAIEYLNHGINISPLDNRLSVWGAFLALTHMISGDIASAKEQAELACQRDDQSYMPRIVLAVIEFKNNNFTSATASIQDAYRVKPDLSDQEIECLVGRRYAKQLHSLLV